MALLDDCRVAVRVSTNALDSELEILIAAAKADMERCGVKPALLDDEALAPIVRSAVVCFVKSHFGLDQEADERDFFQASYRSQVVALLNSDANVASGE